MSRRTRAAERRISEFCSNRWAARTSLDAGSHLRARQRQRPRLLLRPKCYRSARAIAWSKLRKTTCDAHQYQGNANAPSLPPRARCGDRANAHQTACTVEVHKVEPSPWGGGNVLIGHRDWGWGSPHAHMLGFIAYRDGTFSQYAVLTERYFMAQVLALRRGCRDCPSPAHQDALTSMIDSTH